MTSTSPATIAHIGTRTVLGWELQKLAMQARSRLAFVCCLVGPFGFTAALHIAGSVPSDTLFGRWVNDSGFAIPLVVLGFASSWGFPLLTCLVAGDIFSSEDHYGTWQAILTRSAGLGAIFAAKVLAVALYVIAMLTVACFSSLAAGLLLQGHQGLVGLSGTVFSGNAAIARILLSWCSVVLPALAFAAFGVAVSVLTRTSLVAILVPTLIGLGLQLVILLPMPVAIRELLPNTAFLAWHGLFTAPAWYEPILRTSAVSLVYIGGCLWAAWFVLSRRDFDGA